MPKNLELMRSQVLRLKKINEQLQTQLNFDALTGAYTRQYLLDQSSALKESRGHIVFVDLDDFKSVNDHYGHAAGDELLKAISKAMIDVVGNLGFVSRMSGDEFVIALRDVSDDEFANIITQIRVAAGRAALTVGDILVSRTASLGFFKLNGDTSVREAITLANQALLEAKSTGKNRSIGFKRKLTFATPRLPSVDAVKKGLQSNEIGYYVQPIFRTTNLEIDGYEALLRWSLPSGEVLGPSHFLETMTMAYDRVTRPPLLSARKTAEWAAFEKSKYISFNISEAFLMRIAIDGLSWVDELVGSVPDSQIVFEILETVVDPNREYLYEAVLALRNRGIRVALDDFGVGYSNLERLQHLEVDFIKIDKRFIHGALDSDRGLRLFTNMVELSHQSGAQTIIEGIETSEQLEIAQQVKAHFVQGFFLGRPQSIEDY